MESELRQDLVSGDWILIAPRRAGRPHQFKKPKRRIIPPKKACNFENPEKDSQGRVLLSYPVGQPWQVQIIPNKYPVLTPNKRKATLKKSGLIAVMPGIGHHEVVITRSHTDNFPKLKAGNALLLFQAFQDRYLSFRDNKNLAYVSIFHNWGPEAGASLYHPHYQMVAIPVVPPDVSRSLEGSKRYFRRTGKCVHCSQISWERKEKKRIVFENNHAIAFCPFVSKEPFELRIFPKKHSPFFEETPKKEMQAITVALQTTLRKLTRVLNDPDYNFFIHTAPLKKRGSHKHYHWHIEILPRTNISAGFELSTVIEINPVDPDKAASSLRNA